MSEIVSIIADLSVEIIKFAWKVFSTCMHGVKIIVYSTGSIIRDFLRLGI